MRRVPQITSEQLTRVELEAVERDGARVAEWLVEQVRAKLNRDGVASFHVGAAQDAPPWFRVGIEYLRRQTTKWIVTIHDAHGRREYRLVRMLEPKEMPPWKQN